MDRALPERQRKLRRYARATAVGRHRKRAEAWSPTDPDRLEDLDSFLEREASMVEATSCFSSCSILLLVMLKKFPLKCSDLIVTAVNPSTAPDAVIWSSDPSNVVKDAPTVGLPGDYFILQCSYKEIGTTPKQSAQSIRRVVAQMKRQRLLSPNETVSVLARNACLQGRILRQNITRYSKRL